MPASCEVMLSKARSIYRTGIDTDGANMYFRTGTREYCVIIELVKELGLTCGAISRLIEREKELYESPNVR